MPLDPPSFHGWGAEPSAVQLASSLHGGPETGRALRAAVLAILIYSLLPGQVLPWFHEFSQFYFLLSSFCNPPRPHILGSFYLFFISA